jgi:hypothetical protein
MKRWQRHFLTNRQSWQDRALFRSLNMAAQATQPPAGSDLTLYGLCRIAALWVSAFEMLTHPRKGKAGLLLVYPMLERVKCLDKNLRKKTYLAYMTQKKPWQRRMLPCWLYGKLYCARNNLFTEIRLRRTSLLLEAHSTGFSGLPRRYIGSYSPGSSILDTTGKPLRLADRTRWVSF